MRKIVLTAAGLVIAGSAVGGTTVAASAQAQVNWAQRTCSAFAAYQAHPSTAGFRTLVTDSTYLGKSYLKADVLQWAADSASPSPKAAKYAVKDPGYVSDDCQA